MVGKIGILALQGAFLKHEQMLQSLGMQTLQVRYPQELFQCDGLIIPGGESTVIGRHIRQMQLQNPLQEFSHRAPIFGTCAGMILMAEGGLLNLLDITIERNAYGPQSHSFSLPVRTAFSSQPVHALFIRAPRIRSILSSQVQVLAHISTQTSDNEPVLVRQKMHLAASFHPELTNDLTIHKYFINLCKEKKQSLQLPLKTIPTKSFQMI